MIQRLGFVEGSNEQKRAGPRLALSFLLFIWLTKLKSWVRNVRKDVKSRNVLEKGMLYIKWEKNLDPLCSLTFFRGGVILILELVLPPMGEEDKTLNLIFDNLVLLEGRLEGRSYFKP